MYLLLITQLIHVPDLYNKNWAWQNYVAQRSLMQAENVRNQLQRVMERSEIELFSLQDEKKLYQNIRKALVCGFFMQVAHKEGEKGAYLTVKDNQVRSNWVKWRDIERCQQVVALHPSCGLDTQPEWVIFNEFVLTTRNFIRTVSEVRPEWYVYSVLRAGR